MARMAVDDKDLRAARKKNKRQKRIKNYVIVLVILLIGFVCFLLRGYWVPKLKGLFEKPHGLIVNDGTLAAGNFPIMLSDNGSTSLFVSEDMFVSVDDSAIKFFDINGEQQKLIQHTMAHPAACVSDDKMLIYENGGNSFELLGFKGEIYTKKLDENILLAAMKGDTVAIVTSTDKYDACLTVYNNEGSVIYKWSANKRIMSVDIFEDGSGCLVSTFSSNNGVVSSTVTELDFSSEGAAMTSGELDTLVLGAYKNASNDIWAVGDTAIYRIDDKGNILSTTEYNGELCAFDANDRLCAVACSGVARGSSRLMIFNSDDKDITGDVSIDSGKVKALCCDDENVFMLSEHSAECYDLGANLTATAAVSNDYVDFVHMKESLIFVGYRDINKIEFKN